MWITDGEHNEHCTETSGPFSYDLGPFQSSERIQVAKPELSLPVFPPQTVSSGLNWDF